jgi:DNA-binding transcriptional ArsR family regulator
MNEDQMNELPDTVPDQASRAGSVFIIRDLETLRTIADPLRMQIFEQLVETPLTVKELAIRLGLSPSRLYYHMNVLEEHTLIHVVGQNMVGNLVEKIYRAAARELDVAPTLLAFETRAGKESITAMAASTLDVTREDLLRSLEARAYALAEGAPERQRPLMVTRTMQRLPESQVLAIQERLVALLQEFDTGAVDPDDVEEEAHTYALTVALYPHFDYPGIVEEQGEEEEEKEP